ncbi:MAG: mitofilin family membrane protein [Pseudomonadota bacterium]
MPHSDENENKKEDQSNDTKVTSENSENTTESQAGDTEATSADKDNGTDSGMDSGTKSGKESGTDADSETKDDTKNVEEVEAELVSDGATEAARDDETTPDDAEDTKTDDDDHSTDNTVEKSKGISPGLIIIGATAIAGIVIIGAALLDRDGTTPTSSGETAKQVIEEQTTVEGSQALSDDSTAPTDAPIELETTAGGDRDTGESPVEKILNDVSDQTKVAAAALPDTDQAEGTITELPPAPETGDANAGFKSAAKAVLDTIEEQNDTASDDTEKTDTETAAETPDSETADKEEATQEATPEAMTSEATDGVNAIGTAAEGAENEEGSDEPDTEKPGTEKPDPEKAETTATDNADTSIDEESALTQTDETIDAQNADDSADTVASESTQETGTQKSGTTGENADALKAEIQALRNAFEAQASEFAAALAEERETSAQQAATIAELQASFQQELAVKLEQTAAQIAALEERLTGANADGPSSNGGQAAAALALTALARTVETGEPYVNELSVLSRLAPDVDGVAALTQYAETGVPTLGELKSDFDPVADAAIAAEKSAGATDALSSMFANLSGIVTVRPANFTEGDNTPAILSRAEDSLRKDNLSKALEYLGDLKGSAAAVFEPWVAKANANLGANEALNELNATFLTALGD